MTARVLIIAGSDSGGGAGIQGDIKTVTALRGYAMTAITALTAQNTQGVFGIHDVPADFIRQQISLCLDDIGADAIKTGMLSTAATIDAVAQAMVHHGAPLVLDPVMVAKGGAALLQADAIWALKTKLLPRAYVITPNIPEAELLTGLTIRTPENMETAGRALLAMGAQHALIKGGHLDTGSEVVNVLVTPVGVVRHTNARIATKNTHGTGCTLASAIACKLAQGKALAQAVEEAHAYVAGAIAHAPQIGHGHGPLWHMWQH